MSEKRGFPDLRGFLDHLRQEGDLVTVEAPVDPRLELAEIHRRVIAAGGPPALTLAAVAPLPENLPELMLASLIAGRRLRLCPGPGPHPLVADAELALVGRVPPRLRRPEGPFGDHYGYYSLRHDYPVLEVEAVARSAPIVIDARMKPSYPGEVVCDRQTAALVTQQWAEYFPDRQVEMGESSLEAADE